MTGEIGNSDLKDETGALRHRGTLWVVTELYYPEETSTGYYMTKIAEGLATETDVSVLCGQPNYSKKGIRAPKRESHKGVEIFRAAGTTLNKNVIPFRLINMMTLGLSVLLNALWRFRAGDQVLVVTTPPSMPFVVAFASLLRGASYTLLIHDNYPEMIIAVGKMKKGSLFAEVLNYFNRWLYKYAARIIAVGRDMRELLLKKTEGLDVRIDVIPNWAELETVRPRPRSENKMLAELGLADKFVFLYAGNFGRPNDIETIVECAERCLGKTDDVFLFLGFGAKEAWLKKVVASRGLSNVLVLDPRPREEQIDFLNACDIALVSLVDGMLGVSMPSRTYNILAAGKPILALTHDHSELAMVVDENEVGWHIPPGDPDKLSETIREITRDHSRLEAMGERARRAALETYSLETALEKYRRSLDLD